MSDFTFLHTADIHLDSPLRGLERYPGAPVAEIRNATRAAFTNLIDLAIEKKVDFIIIAGDLYDGDWQDYNTGLFFIKEMNRLRQHKISAFIISGNHDAASVLTKQLRLPENVHHFSSESPETFQIESLDVALHGQSFATRAVTENLAQKFPPAEPALFNIGILHTSATGNPNHDTYAPCSLNDLASTGYDYWALGHIHKRELLGQTPYILFPGNIQGRHIREQGAKGCTLVTVASRRIISAEHCDLDVLRWAEIEIDCSKIDDLDNFFNPLVESLQAPVKNAGGRLLAARIILTGATTAHQSLSRERDDLIAQIQATTLNNFGQSVWIEKVIVKTSPAINPEQNLEDGTPAADLLQLLDQIIADDEEIDTLKQELNDLQQRIPQTALSEDDPEFSTDWIRERISEIKDEILPLLLETKE